MAYVYLNQTQEENLSQKWKSNGKQFIWSPPAKNTRLEHTHTDMNVHEAINKYSHTNYVSWLSSYLSSTQQKNLIKHVKDLTWWLVDCGHHCFLFSCCIILQSFNKVQGIAGVQAWGRFLTKVIISINKKKIVNRINKIHLRFIWVDLWQGCTCRNWGAASEVGIIYHFFSYFLILNNIPLLTKL